MTQEEKAPQTKENLDKIRNVWINFIGPSGNVVYQRNWTVGWPILPKRGDIIICVDDKKRYRVESLEWHVYNHDHVDLAINAVRDH